MVDSMQEVHTDTLSQRMDKLSQFVKLVTLFTFISPLDAHNQMQGGNHTISQVC